MQFLVADWPDGDPNQSRVVVREQDPTGAAISGLLLDSQIEYGTHFVLTGSSGGLLTAICTSGPFARADEAAEFLLYVDGRLAQEGASRGEAVDFFLAGL